MVYHTHVMVRSNVRKNFILSHYSVTEKLKFSVTVTIEKLYNFHNSPGTVHVFLRIYLHKINNREIK